MSSRRLLLRAARLIQEHADGMRDSCAGGAHREKLWNCGDCPVDAKGRCPAKVDHDMHERLAKRLRAAA